jgi:exodeoxyribonuclease V alpha subunit
MAVTSIDQKVKISGSIESIVFHNAENGFSIFKIKSTEYKDLVTITGFISNPNEGESASCIGEWIVNPKFGHQIKTTEIRIIPPNTKKGIIKYLSSGLIPGIGPTYAKKLVHIFGDSVIDVIENSPERLREIEGIGQKRQQQLSSAWNEQKKIQEIMIFLHSHSIGTARAVKIFKKYGEEAITIIQHNPYRLIEDIRNIGFKIADQIAFKLGIQKNSSKRIQAGIMHTCHQFLIAGHCAIVDQELITESLRLLDLTSIENILKCIAELTADGKIISATIKEQPVYYLAKIFYIERKLAADILRISKGNIPWKAIDSNALNFLVKDSKITFSTSQKNAINCALKSKFTILTGGPGVGKTTLITQIIQGLKPKNIIIKLCAPTGRAAKRMSEATNIEAKTIHRLLEFNPITQRFRYNEEHPLAADLIICDEVSMIDLLLMQKLTRAISNKTALVLVGDIDQLPSIGPGAILKDCIASGILTNIELTEIFRQSKNSKIITNAHLINKGLMPIYPIEKTITDFYFIPSDKELIAKKIVDMASSRIFKKFNIPFSDIQVITPMNKGPSGAQYLNMLLQDIMNTHHLGVQHNGRKFKVNDKVIQTVNNYDKDIFNGDIGYISGINTEKSEVIINFEQRFISYSFKELDEINLAYAITIHKSQGCEYPAVIIPLSMQHFTLLERNLLYTAVTRGKKLVIIVGEKKALAIAVKKNPSINRLTQLSVYLKQPDLISS